MTRVNQRSISWELIPPTLYLSLLFCASGLEAKKNNFDVYCSRNGDQTTTCIGWEGSMNLTCVSSIGNSMSCKTDNGSEFVCVDNIGATTCISQNNKYQKNTQCVLEYGNTASCSQEDDQSSPALLPIDGNKTILTPKPRVTPRFSAPNTVFE